MKLASFSKSYSMCAEWRSYSMFDRAIALWALALHRAHTHLLSTVIGPLRNFYTLKLHGNTCTSPAIPFKKDTGKIWIHFKKFSSVGTLITWTRQIMMNEVRKGAFLPPPPLPPQFLECYRKLSIQISKINWDQRTRFIQIILIEVFPKVEKIIQSENAIFLRQLNSFGKYLRNDKIFCAM